MHLHCFKLSSGLGGESTSFDLEINATQTVAQYPLHHVAYAPAKFEVSTSNSLGGDAFTRENTLLDPDLWGPCHMNCYLVPSTSCDLCTYKV